jgi:hypothetical protein
MRIVKTKAATSGILTVETVKTIVKVFELKGSLEALEKVLEKVFGLKVFEFEGTPPFEVFKLEVLKVLEFEGALPFKRTYQEGMVGGDQQSTTKQRS